MGRTVFLFLVASSSLPLMAACAGKDSYSASHQTDVRLECEAAVMCHTARGEILSGEPVDDCIDRTSELLDTYSDSEQALYEVTMERCGQFKGCEFESCTEADGSYSRAHSVEIQNHCQQTTLCQIAQNMTVSIHAADDCALALGMQLDGATFTDRTAFETRYARCSAMQACAYVGCQ